MAVRVSARVSETSEYMFGNWEEEARSPENKKLVMLDGCKVACSKSKANSRLRPAKLATLRAPAGGRWWRAARRVRLLYCLRPGPSRIYLHGPVSYAHRAGAPAPAGALAQLIVVRFWFSKALRPAGEWTAHADWPVGREDRQVCGHESTEAPAFRALTTDSLQIRACQDAWMAAIDTGAPMRNQLKADLKIMFEDFMTPQQLRRLRDLPNPVPVNPRPASQRPRGPRRQVIRNQDARVNRARAVVNRGPRR